MQTKGIKILKKKSNILIEIVKFYYKCCYIDD